MSKPRGEGPSPTLSIAPKSFPVGLFMTMPVLGRPSLEESYLSLANWSGSGPFSFERLATFPPQADHVLVDLFFIHGGRGLR